MTTRLFLTLTVLAFLMGTAHGEDTPAISGALARTVSFVTVTKIVKLKDADKTRLPSFPPGTAFDEIFKDFLDRHSGQSKQVITGNGVTIGSSGLILVPKGCVSDAYQIIVTLQDGTVHEAAIVDEDSYEQVELIRINVAEPLPVATLGNSADSRIGDPIITVASRSGNGVLALTGVIVPPVINPPSAPALPNTTWIEGAMTTDGPGGFLFNAKGELIGQNYLRFKPPGATLVFGGALASDFMKPAFASLSAGNLAHRGWTGLRFGLRNSPGAQIDEIVPGSPAFQAGIRAGDIIVRASDQDIEDVHHFLRVISTKMVGDEVRLTVERDQALLDLKLVTGELPRDVKVALRPPPITGKDVLKRIGMNVSAVTDQLRAQFNLPANTKGAVIVDVTSGSAADRRLLPGDLIVEVDHRDVTTPDDLTAQIDAALNANRKSVFLLVETGGAHRYVTLPVGS